MAVASPPERATENAVSRGAVFLGILGAIGSGASFLFIRLLLN